MIHPFLVRLAQVCYLALCILFFTTACGKGSEDPMDCAGISPGYTADIKPILDASCAKSGCHDAITAQNGVNLSTYSTASVVSRQERFLGVINHSPGFPAMPFNGSKLPDHQIRLLTCWVEIGSPE